MHTEPVIKLHRTVPVLVVMVYSLVPGLAVIGEHGIASSRPVATAVALHGIAVASPVGTAIAGIDPSSLGINYHINH